MSIPDIRPGQSIELLKNCTSSPAMASSTRTAGANSSRCTTCINLSNPCCKKCWTPTATSPWPTTAPANPIWALSCTICSSNHAASAHIYGIETREELVSRSVELAQRLEFFRACAFEYVGRSIPARWPNCPNSFDVVTALHARNTAADDAISFAWTNAPALSCWPLLPGRSGRHPAPAQKTRRWQKPNGGNLPPPIHTREFGSQLTNVLRCLRLEATATNSPSPNWWAGNTR